MHAKVDDVTLSLASNSWQDADAIQADAHWDTLGAIIVDMREAEGVENEENRRARLRRGWNW
jgi:hypothetical protein